MRENEALHHWNGRVGSPVIMRGWDDCINECFSCTPLIEWTGCYATERNFGQFNSVPILLPTIR